ncbi:MAG: SpoIIE family protein phosphatase [Clostridiales bacterium]|nr:SpoIIE family protein phosphatase [Clostridiales bacterium]
MLYMNVLLMAAALGIGVIAGRISGIRKQKEWRKNLQWRHRLREYVMTQKMRRAARCLHHLSFSFQEDLEKSLDRMNREAAVSALIHTNERICDSCGRCRSSKMAIQKDAYYLQYLTDTFQKNGEVRREDMPQLFSETCCASGAYMVALNREMEKSQGQKEWKMRFLESRQVAGQELGELEEILGELAGTLEKPVDVTEKWEKSLKDACQHHHLEYRRGMVCEMEMGRKEVFLQLRAQGKRCIPAREAVQAVSWVLGKNYHLVPGSPTIIRDELCCLELEEEPEYQYEVGIAQRPAEGSDLSGDTISILGFSRGRLMIGLSDGMGTGRLAHEESSRVIELCEQLMEAGISLGTSGRLVNSAVFLNESNPRPATLDLHMVDLFQGKMESLKQGTPPTFLWKNGEVQRLETEQTPLGWMGEIESQVLTTSWEQDVLLVFVTDGILEAFPGEEKEEFLEAVLSRMDGMDPQRVAEDLLGLAQETEPPRDDLTAAAVYLHRGRGKEKKQGMASDIA